MGKSLNNDDNSWLDTVERLRSLISDAINFASAFGVERLDHLIGFSNQERTISNVQSDDTSVDILTYVKHATGLKLNQTLIALIKACSVQDVRYAIEVFEETRKREIVYNPGGLFYSILDKKRGYQPKGGQN